MMRDYEIGFIINPEATEEDVKKIIDSVVEILKKNNGSIENVDEWGRRKLAYPIQKHNEGVYIFITTKANGNTVSEVERRLKLSEKVMRYISIRLDERLRKANRLNKKWKRMERLSKRSSNDEETTENEGSDEKEAS